MVASCCLGDVSDLCLINYLVDVTLMRTLVELIVHMILPRILCINALETIGNQTKKAYDELHLKLIA